ncbi:MAG: lipopolysaccharide heptosyltransferase II [Desulfobacterales bacterium]|nr:MAG: lipopolysaccharide heptosyltransferase II [Desulfobacterales bacterium]
MTKPKEIQPRKILVICPNWVGDVVMATPAFDCIRQNYPGAQIIGLIRKYAKGVIEDSPWFDQVLESTDKTTRGFARLAHCLRRLKPDLAIVLPHSIRAALIARLGGIKKIYGYRRGGNCILLTDGPQPRRGDSGILPVPMAHYYLELCRWLNLKIPRQTTPRLFLSDALQARGERLLQHYGIGADDMVIGLNPGAKFGSSKCWPPEYFGELAELLAAEWACKILLFVGPGEGAIARAILASSQTAIINTGKDQVDLNLLKPLIKRCQLLITNDTGPRHYAVAFGVPAVVIMGPTDPRYTAANLEKTVVIRQELACSPCHERKCPEGQHACMAMIKPETVLRESKNLLKRLNEPCLLRTTETNGRQLKTSRRT